ncbi:MAG: 30S ribosomal protein S6e [Candidatus Nanoarchaeia archaeon]|nr:30S ribosomal protein S6e [Candidatus Haiyanarchaeum thermophilum]MCW1303025.1 30S ribosomal protein S6e [Candidatus Haiyanarchaeum thermophilum]MCW1303703.1 30S ribosomal protein S6e [Candidatus Haiyanarchaeum thermophilum]MCW1306383.1 30S ribosomal protein S6e [Candidatus Haiyanarchaeum thermophilum]MCW1307107.1 30S ribosomal protein S6e [Candidatus Haiyanarchaeum thermophilum]
MKIVVNDPKTGKNYQRELTPEEEAALYGRKIGEKIIGDIIKLPGYELEIRGGTDKDGFPMLKSVEGVRRARVLLSGPPGFHPRRKGERRRKTVRGNTISSDIAQVNLKVIKYGDVSLEELFKGEGSGGAKTG